MTKRLLDQRWPWLVIAVIVPVAFVLSKVVDIHQAADWDRRPVGTVEDIEELRERDDVNLLFILVDTLRAERLGSYGYDRDTSPTLDHLAASGIRFDRHLAQSSWTKASMASLWTGLTPARTGVTRFDDMIPPTAVMAAEPLQEAGFMTVGLYRNGWVAPTFGFDQGFEVYQRPVAQPMAPDIKVKNPTLTDARTDQDIAEAAVEFLRINGHERWFVYLHFMDVHEYLYDEESALFGSSYSDNYDNSIRWTDRTIEILLEYLADMDLLDKTIVAIGSDHGEAFLERGFEGHARRVFRETTEIPFIISLPFRLDPGVVVDARTSNVDVWPTLLDLVGLELPDSIDGRSQLPSILAQLRGEAYEAPPRPAFAQLDQNWGKRGTEPLMTFAVVEGDHRYVRVNLPNDGGMQESLFDAAADPHEFTDRSETEPETLERLRATADAYRTQEPDWGEAPTREVGELELNLLRALGYVIE